MLLLVVGNDVRFVSFVVVGFLPPANKVCDGYVFTGVCLSTGVSAPMHAGIHTPGRHPQADTHLPRVDTLPWVDTPSAQCMLGYGQQAGGTHPTGMHSCFFCSSPVILISHRKDTIQIAR